MSDSSNRGCQLSRMLLDMATPTTATVDIFGNVHKGIRRALFEACGALGRAGDEAAREAAARESLQQALHFVKHHGDNEDACLLPMLRARAPEVFARMRDGHTRIEEQLVRLAALAQQASVAELYPQACAFLAAYLEHMHEEEQVLEPMIRACLSTEELSSFGRRSIERTRPEDQRMMLGYMLPAMPACAAEALLARLPPAFSAELRPLAQLP